MAVYHFEHYQDSRSIGPGCEIDLPGDEAAYEMAAVAAHEMASEVARRMLDGEIFVVVYNQARQEVARAKVTWTLTATMQDTAEVA